MPECLFCKIIAGALNAKVVAETEELLAFSDINPQAPVHILIIPKRHVSGLAACADSDVELLGKIQLFARDLAAKNGLEKGWRLVTNNGRNAGQSVDHLHYHLLGGRRMNWPPG